MYKCLLSNHILHWATQFCLHKVFKCVLPNFGGAESKSAIVFCLSRTFNGNSKFMLIMEKLNIGLHRHKHLTMWNHYICFHPRNLAFVDITPRKQQSSKCTTTLSWPLTLASLLYSSAAAGLLRCFRLCRSLHSPQSSPTAIWYHCLSFAVDLFIPCLKVPQC